VYHLDALFWKPGWNHASKEEQRAVQMDLIQQDEWVIDGNYSATMDIRLAAADTIIFLDFPRLTCIYRVLKRYVKYRKRTSPDMGEGCKERLEIDFLKWVWNYPKKNKPIILKKLNQLASDKKVIILKSPKEVQLFLETIN